jgi:hypothetical protein
MNNNPDPNKATHCDDCGDTHTPDAWCSGKGMGQ